jgi:hypothetical protein
VAIVTRPGSTARRRGAAVLAALAACLPIAACASIPSSSRPQVINPSVAAPPAQEADPRYAAINPQPGEQPIDIVRDFLAVGGSFERRHERARAYLTDAAKASWTDEGGVTVLEDAVYLDVRRGGAEISLRAQRRGVVEQDGSYEPDPAAYTHPFKLEKNSAGEWRIANPPAGVLVTRATFNAAYRPYSVYFLDWTRSKVVPDVRFFAAGRDKLPSLLVGAYERGPSKWLAGAVLSDLDGARLQSNVVQESDRVRVYLTGLGDSADAMQPGGFAQLVWTLNQLGVGGVETYIDGQPVQPGSGARRPLQRLTDWASFDPDALPPSTPGFYVRDGVVRTTNDAAVPRPAGQGDYDARSVAVSMNRRMLAVVGRDSRNRPTLFVGRFGAALRPVLTGASLTPPSWGASDDEVWTVRDGHEILVVPVVGQPRSAALGALGQAGPIRSLRLSRDGARVALVAGPSQRASLLVGVVIRRNTAARVDRLRELDVGDEPVSEASWSDNSSLYALVRARQQDSALFALGIDGESASQLVSTTGLPGPPEALAAPPQPGLPLLTVAAGALWQTLASGEPWTRAQREPAEAAAPVYPG